MSSFCQDEDLQKCGVCQFLLCDNELQNSPEEQKAWLNTENKKTLQSWIIILNVLW